MNIDFLEFESLELKINIIILKNKLNIFLKLDFEIFYEIVVYLFIQFE